MDIDNSTSVADIQGLTATNGALSGKRWGNVTENHIMREEHPVRIVYLSRKSDH